MTDQELKDPVDIDLLQTETDRILQENAQQLQRLGEKFGGFTEGMAYPSMLRVLCETLE